MRPLRNPLAECCILLASVFLVTSLAVAGNDTAQATNAAGAGNPYFPLAVGNVWTYRCSVEGVHQFDKTVRVTATVVQKGVSYYRTELTVKRDQRSVVYYLTAAPNGSVFESPNPSDEARELLIASAPAIGDQLGEWKVAASETISTPALKQVETLRLENMPRDDPTLPDEKRMEWRGRYYARGVGLVAEADGLGGECELLQYRLVPPH